MDNSPADLGSFMTDEGVEPQYVNDISRLTAIFVANRAFALTNSRLPLMSYFLEAGWRVIAAIATDADNDTAERLTALGVGVEIVSFDRRILSPFSDAKAYLTLRRLYRKYNPSLIHHFNAKPVILGSLAAATQRRDAPRVVNTITGLGQAFAQSRLIRAAAGWGYGLARRRASVIIFQNPDDRACFVDAGWVEQHQARLIISSGVDTSKFRPPQSDLPDLIIVMAARLLRQKGIAEFIEAAQNIKADFPEVRFVLAGESEPHHRDAFPEDVIKKAVSDGTIEYAGFVSSFETFLPSASIFVLPSYYAEGVPRVLLEASACGVPVIAVDIPGSREVIIDGKTGALIPPRDADTLTQVINDLIINPGKRAEMGRAAREFMLQSFDLEKVIAQQVGIYQELGMGPDT